MAVVGQGSSWVGSGYRHFVFPPQSDLVGVIAEMSRAICAQTGWQRVATGGSSDGWGSARWTNEPHSEEIIAVVGATTPPVLSVTSTDQRPLATADFIADIPGGRFVAGWFTNSAPSGPDVVTPALDAAQVAATRYNGRPASDAELFALVTASQWNARQDDELKRRVDALEWELGQRRCPSCDHWMPVDSSRCSRCEHGFNHKDHLAMDERQDELERQLADARKRRSTPPPPPPPPPPSPYALAGPGVPNFIR